MCTKYKVERERGDKCYLHNSNNNNDNNTKCVKKLQSLDEKSNLNLRKTFRPPYHPDWDYGWDYECGYLQCDGCGYQQGGECG